MVFTSMEIYCYVRLLSNFEMRQIQGKGAYSQFSKLIAFGTEVVQSVHGLFSSYGLPVCY